MIMKTKYIAPSIDTYSIEMKSLICGSLKYDGTNVIQTGAGTTTQTTNNLSRDQNDMWEDDSDDE